MDSVVQRPLVLVPARKVHLIKYLNNFAKVTKVSLIESSKILSAADQIACRCVVSMFSHYLMTFSLDVWSLRDDV